MVKLHDPSLETTYFFFTAGWRPYAKMAVQFLSSKISNLAFIITTNGVFNDALEFSHGPSLKTELFMCGM